MNGGYIRVCMHARHFICVYACVHVCALLPGVESRGRKPLRLFDSFIRITIYLYLTPASLSSHCTSNAHSILFPSLLISSLADVTCHFTFCSRNSKAAGINPSYITWLCGDKDEKRRGSGKRVPSHLPCLVCDKTFLIIEPSSTKKWWSQVLPREPWYSLWTKLMHGPIKSTL